MWRYYTCAVKTDDIVITTKSLWLLTIYWHSNALNFINVKFNVNFNRWHCTRTMTNDFINSMKLTMRLTRGSGKAAAMPWQGGGKKTCHENRYEMVSLSSTTLSCLHYYGMVPLIVLSWATNCTTCTNARSQHDGTSTIRDIKSFRSLDIQYKCHH